MRSPTLFQMLVLALALSACSERRAVATIAFEDCRLPKLSTAARCTTIEVPENRDAPAGRRIRLFVAVLPANTLSPKPDPLLIIAGGPGQSASSLAVFASRLIEVRRTRDVILVDQRGTGRSAPLDCKAFKLDEDPSQALDIDPLPRARLCLDELIARNVDVSQYTTAAWIADLEAVRTALGISRWNLWGGSYGTRVALEYVRRHGAQVRSMILDGVAPPSLRVSSGVWPTREEALFTLLDACVANAACGRSHTSLRRTLDQLEEMLRGGRDVDLVDPRTGERARLRLTFDAMLIGMQPLVYVPELSVMIPVILERAAAGDFAPLFASAQLVTGELAEQTSAALHYAVTCSEDAPRVTDEDRAALKTLRSGVLAHKVLGVCDIWPKNTQSDEATKPVRSDAPALLLSGALDPVTPPRYAEEVATTLSNHRHVVAGGYGHIVSPHACGPRLIAAFVERAGFDTLPQSCIDYFTKSTRPPLWPDRLAPAT
ncbi:MAG TPA: alpha/beta fold hydrolase [Casimicrobiaceae bacterium]|nr:alpha/beta fold hydrolase [Casimicrobiaceae bacterium]